jgi:hypothetical protein
MSDELNVLQETATQARAKADELKAALTDQSSKRERTAAENAEADAVKAEAAYADATAKAEAAAQGGDAQPKVGDPCTNADGVTGTWQQAPEGMICVVEPPPAPPAPPKEEAGATVPDANESRTGFADAGLHPGDACVCPDGRTGTVQRFEVGLICLPNQG